MLDVRLSPVGPGRVKTFSIFQELNAAGRDPRRRDHLSIFLAAIRAQPRASLSDLNSHTARTAVHAPHAPTAARSGLIPTMFITRVRL
jgi:hypothetical protein